MLFTTCSSQFVIILLESMSHSLVRVQTERNCPRHCKCRGENCQVPRFIFFQILQQRVKISRRHFHFDQLTGMGCSLSLNFCGFQSTRSTETLLSSDIETSSKKFYTEEKDLTRWIHENRQK
ncbi:hypothetical protein Y032_0014g2316 [Ancylostoma ceylanicum]|uniref:Uncharacterized protein n=1 Tax=Ancylostoma ceylanicum TaxID=53326 RepID=A0A016V9K2_9BILA|nr:hypothetical protein Y032_0014g2316 [Ancylostoma ceylanicum]